MGKRDFRHHESKKPKKGAKKTSISDLITPPMTVEVLGKRKRKKGADEEAASPPAE
jgi:hypothetical protein